MNTTENKKIRAAKPRRCAAAATATATAADCEND